MDEPQIPQVYLVNRNLHKEDVWIVDQALSLTPVGCSVISDPHDAALALAIVPSIVKATTDDTALQMAQQIAQESSKPVLVIGQAEFLDAIYKDGTRVPVATVC